MKLGMSETVTPELGAALVGLTIWKFYEAYRDQAPSLDTLRACRGSNKSGELQGLIDADITVGIVALIASGGLAVMSRSWWPIILLGIAYVATVGYTHSILSDN